MGFKSVLATSYHICAIKTPEGCLVLLKPSGETAARGGNSLPRGLGGRKIHPPSPRRALAMVSSAARPELREGDGAGDAGWRSFRSLN